MEKSLKGPPTANIAIQTDQKSKIGYSLIHSACETVWFLFGISESEIFHVACETGQTVFLVLNLEEVKIENEDLQAEVDQLRNQLVFAEENNARRIREIKTESSNEVFLA